MCQSSPLTVFGKFDIVKEIYSLSEEPSEPKYFSFWENMKYMK